MSDELWITAGAPLEGGRGWRVWYSWPRGDFKPARIDVRRRGRKVECCQHWAPLEPILGYPRRMGILTVKLAAPESGVPYDVRIPERRGLPPLAWHVLPTQIGEGVSFLIASCFWRYDDKEGAYAAGMRDLQRRLMPKPAFKFLMGDQLYLDWPLTWLNAKSPLEMFSSRYEAYWGDSIYRELLASSPTYFACDDHEFWNNYPEWQPQLPYTWATRDRQASLEAARALYHGFQHAANPDKARFFSFRVHPVSFFVADPRSERTPFDTESPRFFSDEQWSALEKWADDLVGPGVLVIGQPLFQKAGDWKDRSLANFADDYGRLGRLFEEIQTGQRTSGRRHDVLVLTGDIHTGRYSAATIKESPAAGLVHEFVASPASLVGPFVKTHKPNEPPSRIRLPYGGRERNWEVVVRRSDDSPSVDNNVGAVTMSRGTNGRVRFRLELHVVRAYDRWTYLHRLGPRSAFGRVRAPGAPRRIFTHEIELD
jgi:PhoD-like phosphatase